MFENLNEITTEEISENGVCSAPDVLSGTPEENKKVFDKLCAEVVIPKINIIVREGKVLEKLLGTNTDEATRLNHAIKSLEHSVGNVNSVDFDGNLRDADVIVLTGLARNTYYKYKKELKEEM